MKLIGFDVPSKVIEKSSSMNERRNFIFENMFGFTVNGSNELEEKSFVLFADRMKIFTVTSSGFKRVIA